MSAVTVVLQVEFEANGMGDKIILMWPVILTHRITPDSPLYDMRPADLSAEKLEIILFLTGTVEATGEVSPLSVVASFTSPGSLTPSLP